PAAGNGKGGTVASASFMLTNAQKAQLRALGYSDAQIAEMKPEHGHKILEDDHQRRLKEDFPEDDDDEPPFDDPKPEPPTIEDATALRRALVAAGYVPLPLYGKTPPVYGKNNQRKGFGDWQNLTVLTDEMVAMWKKTWPDALKTVVTDEMIAMWAKTWPDA